MKMCAYCRAELPDGASRCEFCGSSELLAKCANCGTVIHEGIYCPKCGVKAGSKPRVCPVCRTEYYSSACPDCGYMPERSGGVAFPAGGVIERKPKRWLWVLGWLFIFPLPLTVLMLRREDINKWLRAGINVAAWVVYLALGTSGNSGA